MKFFRLAILFLLSINTILVSSFAGGTRTIEMVNNCPFTVLWAAKGTPIKDKGEPVYCKKANLDGTGGDKFGAACFNNKGYCGQQLYHYEKLILAAGVSKDVKTPNEVSCFFKYPTLISKSDANPDYVLLSKASRKYTVDLIDRQDSAESGSKVVTQYSLNVISQFDCSSDGKNYNCHSAPCGERLYSDTKASWDEQIPTLPTAAGSIPSGTCSPDKGVTSAFTQAEFTFNDKENDFYDISIINGVNVPISINPNGTFGNQSMQSEFFCKTTGGKPTGTPGYMKGCNWKFTPPAGYPSHIFTEVFANSPKKTCTLDSQCSTGSVCGLEYPVGYLDYNGFGVCGKPIAYQTMANISPLVSPSGIASKLNDIFKLRETFDLYLKNDSDSGKKSFTNNQLFMCETVKVDGHKYLDSCYNYCHGQSPCDVITPDAAGNTNSSTACCGCIDWPGVPTDKNDNCTGSNKAKEKWLATVKPLLEWLIVGCPDAYEYQYGDKHGTMQCSSKDNPGDSAINNINYTITFCPNGEGVFGGATVLPPPPPPVTPISAVIQSSADVVASDNSAFFSWQIGVTPSATGTITYKSTSQLYKKSDKSLVKTEECTQANCVVNLMGLASLTDYILKINAEVAVGVAKANAAELVKEFKTTGTFVFDIPKINNPIVNVLSDTSIKIDWQVRSIKPGFSSIATLKLGNAISPLGPCMTANCTVTFTSLTPDTNYDIEIKASNAGLLDIYSTSARTKTKSIVIVSEEVLLPTVTNVSMFNDAIAAGVRCPKGQKRPALVQCNNKALGMRCLNAISASSAKTAMGQWLINKPAPVYCFNQTLFSNPVLNELVVTFGGGITFTFMPNLGWTCQSQGNKLICIK